MRVEEAERLTLPDCKTDEGVRPELDPDGDADADPKEDALVRTEEAERVTLPAALADGEGAAADEATAEDRGLLEGADD